MKYKVFLILLFVIFSGIRSYSQTTSSQINEEFPLGSVYSYFGVGDVHNSTSIRTESMSILGISLFGEYVNNLNPAANSKLSYTNVNVSFKYSFFNSSSDSKSISASNGNIQGLNIGIPFNKDNGWVMNLGFNPLSQINYRIERSGNLYGKDYTEIYAGNGGLSRINVGMSYKIFHYFNMGLEYNFTFGNLKRVSFLDFNNAEYTNTYIRKENSAGGSYFKGGLIFELGKMMKNKNIENLSFGLLFQSKLRLTSELDKIYESSTGKDTIPSLEGDIDVPQAFGFGVTNSFGRLLVSSDFLYQQWSNFAMNGYTYSSTYANSFKWGLGIALTPPDKKELGFWEGVEYRFGVFINNSYFKINDEQINGYGLGLGFGIPLNRYNSIDLGFNLYTRGNTNPGFVKDNYFKMSISLNFGELWFIKRTEE